MPPAVWVLGPDFVMEVALTIGAALLLHRLLLRHLQRIAGAIVACPRQTQITGGVRETGQVDSRAAQSQGCAGGIHSCSARELCGNELVSARFGILAEVNRKRCIG